MVASLLGRVIVLGTGGAGLARDKKDNKADDNQTRLNKALSLAAGIGQVDQAIDADLPVGGGLQEPTITRRPHDASR